jgi:hypothetical protein
MGMDIFDKMSGDLKYNKSPKNPSDKDAKDRSFSIENIRDVMANNKIFSRRDIDRYNLINRYGFIDVYNTDTVLKEVLLFTKPDLNLLQDYNTLNPEIAVDPYMKDTFSRMPDIFRQLQYSITTKKNPFMYLFSNQVTSKLDIPEISAEETDTTNNEYGVNMQYRSNSIKSNYNGLDFSLSFDDTDALEIYNTAKVYDRYVNMCKRGECSPFRRYIVNNVADNQFSIYKMLISGNDGETILYFGKVTGVYIKNVPRDAMNDPQEIGKITLSFHGQWAEDSEMDIVKEINLISPVKNGAKYLDVYNPTINAVDNTWAKYPYIEKSDFNDARASRRGVGYDYRLKWTNNVI